MRSPETEIQFDTTAWRSWQSADRPFSAYGWMQSAVAKGREAIDAVRKPLFVLLLLNGILAGLALAIALIRPDWSAISATMVAWLH